MAGPCTANPVLGPAELAGILGGASTTCELGDRDQRSLEIDFVIEAGGRLSLLECKWRDRLTLDDARHLLAVREDIASSSSPWQTGSSWVIGTAPASYPMAEQVSAGGLRDLRSILQANQRVP